MFGRICSNGLFLSDWGSRLGKKGTLISSYAFSIKVDCSPPCLWGVAKASEQPCYEDESAFMMSDIEIVCVSNLNINRNLAVAI